MKKFSKNKSLDAVQTKQTSVSITRTERLNPDINLFTAYIVVSVFMSPIVLHFAISGFWVLGMAVLAGHGLLLKAVKSTIQWDWVENKHNQSSATNGHRWINPIEVDKYPESKKLLTSIPFAIDMDGSKDLDINKIIYNEEDKVDAILATHFIDETAIWKDKKLYIEQTIRETPYTMWHGAFQALVKEEEKCFH